MTGREPRRAPRPTEGRTPRPQGARVSASARLSVRLQDIAQSLAEVLDDVAGEPVPFVLVCQADGVAQYVSNADRKDGRELIESLLARWRAGRADIPAHYNPDEARGTMNAMQLMDARDEAHRATLERIGQEIGYGRAQQMLGEAWDAMLDREYPSPAGTPRSGRGRMGVGANVPVGEVVIGPSPIDGSEGFTMVRWAKDRGCPPVGTRLYAEKLHPANRWRPNDRGEPDPTAEEKQR